MELSNERFIAPQATYDEVEQGLRPRKLMDFVGQDHLKESLDISLTAARMRGEAVDHLLFAGPPGLGKTTLAGIIAEEMGSKLHVTSGPVLDKPSDLAGLLTNLAEGDILFIDEIHRLPRIVEEYLYPAMEDFRLDILLESGPMARSINLPLKRFTLVAATTRSGMLTSPLRDRFGLQFRLDLYNIDDLQSIVMRSSKILGTPIDLEGAALVAARSRGTPRIANRILRRCRDVAQVRGVEIIDVEVTERTLKMLGIDDSGLDEMDRRFLKYLVEKFDGGPVGLGTLGSALGEEAQTLEEVYEPYLIQQGYLKRTPRGRMATHKSYQLFGLKIPQRLHENDLFSEIGEES
jgi:Holliday junction DNA helicase RuvB